MELIINIFNYIVTAILFGASGAWIILIKSMKDSFKFTPFLEDFNNKSHNTPKVSIILPARNEEEYIGKCLDSLIEQDYENYEIIAINDSSEDNTQKIMKEYSEKTSKIIFVDAKPKPDGWMGKNWACMEGYKKSSGSILLFTDSDTFHSKNILSLAVAHLISCKLDALTVIPKMLCMDIWTKITLPMISTFLHTRFSALKVNDPKKKTGYFFGSFFIIKRDVYESVGAHEGVKQEIIEDGALGKKVKESGHKMKMVRGDHLINAIWARDKTTLWNALKRLMVPLYLQNSRVAIGIFVAVLFLLFIPFPTLVYSGVFVLEDISFSLLFAIAAVNSVLIYFGAIIEAKELHLKIQYAILGPIGSLVIVLAFLNGMIQAKSNSAVSWRGRKYSLKEHTQNSINV